MDDFEKDMTAQQDNYKICFNRKYSVVFIIFFFSTVYSFIFLVCTGRFSGESACMGYLLTGR